VSALNWINVCLSVVRDRSSAPKDFEVYGIVDAGRGVARYAKRHSLVIHLVTVCSIDPLIFLSLLEFFVSHYRLIAKGRYEINGTSAVVQNFGVKDDSHRQADQPFQAVSLRVLSNHGNPSFTCLYRFRVHGIPLP